MTLESPISKLKRPQCFSLGLLGGGRVRDVNQTMYSMLYQHLLGFCPLLTESILEGLTSKKILWCLCMFYVCVGTGFCGLTKERYIIYIYEKFWNVNLLMRVWLNPEVTLCSWWDVKIQLLPNFCGTLPRLYLYSFIACLFWGIFL